MHVWIVKEEIGEYSMYEEKNIGVFDSFEDAWQFAWARAVAKGTNPRVEEWEHNAIMRECAICWDELCRTHSNGVVAPIRERVKAGDFPEELRAFSRWITAAPPHVSGHLAS